MLFLGCDISSNIVENHLFIIRISTKRDILVSVGIYGFLRLHVGIYVMSVEDVKCLSACKTGAVKHNVDQGCHINNIFNPSLPILQKIYIAASIRIQYSQHIQISHIGT